MAMEKGQLSIHTENFLPIIKKWLYSDRDIFVRELVSNGCDAVAKRRMVGHIPEAYAPAITVRVDKEHRILSFTDNGVGMTAEEVRKYINQVAFSGANDFMEKYKDSGRVCIVDDCNCMQLKYDISKCRFFVGARTHATIAAYSTCVPTLVVGYSVKSRGIARDLF